MNTEQQPPLTTSDIEVQIIAKALLGDKESLLRLVNTILANKTELNNLSGKVEEISGLYANEQAEVTRAKAYADEKCKEISSIHGEIGELNAKNNELVLKLEREVLSAKGFKETAELLAQEKSMMLKNLEINQACRDFVEECLKAIEDDEVPAIFPEIKREDCEKMLGVEDEKSAETE